MKRETRRFVVEVRRGSKKQGAAFLPAPPEAQPEKTPAAEQALFSKDTDQDSGAQKKGRILESIVEPAPQPVEEAVESEPPRRRGRPPGSKNKKTSRGAPAMRAPRGRPKVGPEVRRIALTPELVDEAMATMSRMTSANGLAKSESGTPGFEEEAGDDSTVRARQEGFADAASSELWASSATPGEAARARGVKAAAKLSRTEARRLLKPGERWKRRIRSRALTRRSRRG